MKLFYRLHYLFCTVIIALIVISCDSNAGQLAPVVVSADSVTKITPYNAYFEAVIADNRGATVTSCGFCWSSNGVPTIADLKTVDTDTKTGRFSATIPNLLPNLSYQVRPYAITSKGVGYGRQRSLKTPNLVIISTKEATAITSTTAMTGGNIFFDYGVQVSSRGICWSTNPHPTINDFKADDSLFGTGYYDITMTNLLPKTTYFVCAYAINANGISYGNQISFITAD